MNQHSPALNTKSRRCILMLATFCLVFVMPVARADILSRLKKGDKLHIAAIGTSLTSKDFSAENWFAQMGTWLSSQYPGQVALSNRAVSGTCSCNLPQFDRPHGGFWQLEQVLANDNPDVIFIEFAINDGSKLPNLSVADSRKNLRSMIDQINAWASDNKKSVEIIVQTMNNTGPACEASYKDVGPYYQGWAEEAAANHLLLIDHYANWLKLYDSEPNHATWKSYVPDDLHPNPLGTAKVIVPAIQKALNEQAAAVQKAAAVGLPAAETPAAATAQERTAPPNPKLVKLPFSFRPREFECAPVLYKGRPFMGLNRLYKELDKTALYFRDLITGEEGADIAPQFAFSSVFANGDELSVFGTEVGSKEEWTKNIHRFSSTDMKTWKREVAITPDGDGKLFNTSVCRDEQGYVMAYESNKPVQWSFRFARSKDLSKWDKVEGLEFADVEGQSACANPVIRYVTPYYYAIYGAFSFQEPHKSCYRYQLPETKYITVIARSKDLATWELSPTRGPMLDPVPGEGINNTDADLFGYEGNTYVYYVTGDQSGTWGTIRVAIYAGPMKEMLEAYFPDGVPTIKFDAKQRKYIYPPKQ